MQNLKKSETADTSDFEKELLKPLYDLMSHIETKSIRKAIDVGCGTGRSTELLIKLAPNANISGIDFSEEMISIARKKLPKIELTVENISNWKGANDYDLILANSVFHWIPNHREILPVLISKLNIGGTLAIQMPDNSTEPALKLMDSISTYPRLAHKFFNSIKSDPRCTPEVYYEILSDKVERLEIWRTTYFHTIAGGIDGLINWLKGFGLQRLLNNFTESEQRYFLREYKKELAKVYHVHENGYVLIPFPRVFIIASK